MNFCNFFLATRDQATGNRHQATGNRGKRRRGGHWPPARGRRFRRGIRHQASGIRGRGMRGNRQQATGDHARSGAQCAPVVPSAALRISRIAPLCKRFTVFSAKDSFVRGFSTTMGRTARRPCFNRASGLWKSMWKVCKTAFGQKISGRFL